ncbi:MAG: hypothetical protein R2856_25960 [Caldilineaceae bacterium]
MRRLNSFLRILLFVLVSLVSAVTPAAAQGNQITYGLVQDSTDPLLVTAVVWPNFTSTDVDLSTAVFSLMLPAGTTTMPSVNPLPSSGGFTNINGSWTAWRLTPSVYASVGGDPADLAGYDVYQVSLGPGTASPPMTSGEAVPLFSFRLPADCRTQPVAVLTNDGAIQQAIANRLGTNFNNQMSVSVDGATAVDLYAGTMPLPLRWPAP